MYAVLKIDWIFCETTARKLIEPIVQHLYFKLLLSSCLPTLVKTSKKSLANKYRVPKSSCNKILSLNCVSEVEIDFLLAVFMLMQARDILLSKHMHRMGEFLFEVHTSGNFVFPNRFSSSFELNSIYKSIYKKEKENIANYYYWTHSNKINKNWELNIKHTQKMSPTTTSEDRGWIL